MEVSGSVSALQCLPVKHSQAVPSGLTQREHSSPRLKKPAIGGFFTLDDTAQDVTKTRMAFKRALKGNVPLETATTNPECFAEVITVKTERKSPFHLSSVSEGSDMG